MPAAATGVQSVSFLATTSDQFVTLSSRYQYVTVENQGTGVVVWVRLDGNPATVGGDFCTSVEPGERVLVANELPLWNQSQSVIPAGSNPATPNPGQPGTVSPFGSALGGQAANPGTTVHFIAGSGGTPGTVTVTAAG